MRSAAWVVTVRAPPGPAVMLQERWSPPVTPPEVLTRTASGTGPWVFGQQGLGAALLIEAVEADAAVTERHRNLGTAAGALERRRGGSSGMAWSKARRRRGGNPR